MLFVLRLATGWKGGYRPASGEDYQRYLIPAFKSDDLMGGLTLASENIGALLLNGELSEDRGIITVSIPLFHYRLL